MENRLRGAKSNQSDEPRLSMFIMSRATRTVCGTLRRFSGQYPTRSGTCHTHDEHLSVSRYWAYRPRPFCALRAYGQISSERKYRYLLELRHYSTKAIAGRALTY